MQYKDGKTIILQNDDKVGRIITITKENKEI